MDLGRIDPIGGPEIDEMQASRDRSRNDEGQSHEHLVDRGGSPRQPGLSDGLVTRVAGEGIEPFLFAFRAASAGRQDHHQIVTGSRPIGGTGDSLFVQESVNMAAMDSLNARSNYIISKIRELLPDSHPVHEKWNMAGAFNGAMFVKDRASAALYFYGPKIRKAIDSPHSVELGDMSVVMTTNVQVRSQNFRDVVLDAHEDSKSIPESAFTQVLGIEISTMDAGPGLTPVLQREFSSARLTWAPSYRLEEDTYQDFNVRFASPIPLDQAAQAVRRVIPIPGGKLFGAGEVFATLVKRNAPVKWAHVIARQF